jgi:hypothetical protein
MYSKFKKANINCLNQKECNSFRYDYEKTKIDFSTLIRGEDEKIKDCR